MWVDSTGIVTIRGRFAMHHGAEESSGDGTGEVPAPAFLTRTSGELLGRRPLPRVIARPVLVVLGPTGVGKTTVARRLLGGSPAECAVTSFRQGLVAAARAGWPADLRYAPDLLFDDIDCLHGRWGAVDLLGQLLRDRAAAGRRTILCQGGVDPSVTLIYGQLPLTSRATLLLRFPVGRGRRRYVVQRCHERGIPFPEARAAVTMEPWSYAAVEHMLDRIARHLTISG